MWIANSTIKVGINLKSATTDAAIGNIIRGNAELRMRRPPAVIDLAPAVIEFVII